MNPTQETAGEHLSREELENRISRLEEALRKAEESARYRSAFTASLSYEIRTPLNSIIGVANLFQGTRLDLEQKKFVEMLSSSAKDLLALVEELLDLSLIETGKIALRNDPFPVRAVCSRTIQPMAVSVQERRLALELRVDPSVPEYLRGDGARLAQILRNMAANAISLTPKGTVKVRVFLAEEAPASVILSATVTHPDRRPGGETTHAEISIAPGQKGPGATVQNQGMDLLIAGSVAGSMGGKLWESSPAPGERTIHFQAPMGKNLPGEDGGRAAPAAEKDPEPVRDALPPDLSILVVDDNRFNRSLTRTILRKMGGPGWKISLAEGGKEALDLVAEEKYDLILMDVQMPEMDGLECTRRIRAGQGAGRGGAAAIIAMTAYAMEGDRQMCLSAGMDDYIAKPVDAGELQLVIGRNLPQNLLTRTPSAD